MAKPYRLEDMLKKVREVLDGERDEVPWGISALVSKCRSV